MQRFVTAAASAAAAIVMPCAVQAQQQQPSAMTHQEQVTFAKWSATVQKELARQLFYPHPMFGKAFDTGVVQVKFNCSDSGRPDKVAIARSSGSPALDRAALRAVSHISTLHPLPASFAHGQAFQAMVLFDTDYDGYATRRAKLLADAEKRNARFADPKVAMLGVVPVGSLGN